MVSGAVKETRMQFIQIHFSPATFDELELDVRVTIGRHLQIGVVHILRNHEYREGGLSK